MLYRMAGIGLAASVIIAALLGYSAWNKADNTFVAAWLGVMLCVCAGGALLLYRFRREEPDARAIDPWYRLAFGGAMAAALTWGVAGYVLVQARDVMLPVLTLLTLTGIAAGAVPALAAVWRIYAAYCVIMLAPAALALITRGEIEWLTTAALLLVFVLAIILFAWHHAATLANALQLGFRNDALARKALADKDKTEALNASLQKEMAQYREMQQELTRTKEAAERRNLVHATGERNVRSLLRMVDCIPLLLPPVGADLDVRELVARVDGVVLTGGRANIEPHHYDGPPFPDDEIIDPGRDELVLPLVRACIEARVPIFGICRGIQEINVALGGSLHYRIHQVDGKNDHRRPRRDDVTQDEVFRLNHLVKFAKGGLFQSLTGHDEMMVNSLHGQGVDRLGKGLVVEATSPDGVVEGIRYDDNEQFIVGVQWHAEWKPEEHALSSALYTTFGEAARARATRRVR